ncbi:MAG: pilin [Wenzhouxiangella sp.]|nr:pilin [Wenzhouxiangella sp.]
MRAQVSEGMHLGSGARAAIWDFWSNTGNMPASNSEAGLVPPSSIAGRYVSKLEIDNGEVVIWFDTGAENAAITGKTLILTPSPVPGEGAMAWECNQGTVPERYLPARCR